MSLKLIIMILSPLVLAGFSTYLAFTNISLGVSKVKSIILGFLGVSLPFLVGLIISVVMRS